MSRPREAYLSFLKTHSYVYNFTIRGKGYPLNKIIDSFKGIESIKIDAKEIERGIYDFILSFGTCDDKIFHQKLEELEQIREEDFPRTEFIMMKKIRGH